MLDFSGSTTVYLACGVTDLRKSYTGLAAIIKLKFHLDPYSRCMFAFCNRRRTLIKILQWDGSGFWILMKRLERDAFHWPDTPDELRKVTLKEIHWLCDGLSLDILVREYRCSGGTDTANPAAGNRCSGTEIPHLIDCYLRVHSLKAGSNPYTSRIDR